MGVVHEASLRRQISMNCLISETSRGILAVIERKRGGGEVLRVRFVEGCDGLVGDLVWKC